MNTKSFVKRRINIIIIIIIIYNPPFPNFLSILCERLPKLHDLGSSAHFPKASNSKFHRDFRNCFYAEWFFHQFSRFPLRHSFLKEFCLQGQCQPSQSRDFGKHLRTTISSHLHSSDFSTTCGKTAPGIPRSVESVAQKSRTSSEF